MEETVGKLWDRFITRVAEQRHPAAAVHLEEVGRHVAIVFRALGGDPALRVAPAVSVRHGARRRLLARLAGTGERWTPAARSPDALRLPGTIAEFASRERNRELYVWLAALAAYLGELPPGTHPGIGNQDATRRLLTQWPGLAPLYRRLVAAHLAARPVPASLPDAQAALESAIRAALVEPGAVHAFPPAPAPEWPVPLWVVTRAAGESACGSAAPPAPAGEPPAPPAADRRREAHAATRVAHERRSDGILMRFRAESLLTIGEYVRVNRAEDDEPDRDPGAAARDLDQVTLAAGTTAAASRVRFDLDLPSAAEDDVPLSDGIPLPEWNHRRGVLEADRVRLKEMLPRDARPAGLPERLRPLAMRLRRQFAALQPARHWNRARLDGPEIDVDAAVRAATDWRRGIAAENVYQACDRRERDLACLVLADLSLSTDAWVSGEHRVIDVVRDGLLLLGETLAATGDRFALCGFSSVRRSNVRFLRLKAFDERFGASVRGRLLAIKPGFYTRMGAAIRHATALLEPQPAARRLLMIISDGKPNDLDRYEGRYGIEDTRQAILAARGRGVRPFCVTVDREGGSYLPHVFGAQGFVIIRRPEELPQRLTGLYADLTR
ncbi:MAG: nitric oxide reductase [Proteobacteria bacterium]|nr:nitric oxide reductase [Pseudomonadota bacterium]